MNGWVKRRTMPRPVCYRYNPLTRTRPLRYQAASQKDTTQSRQAAKTQSLLFFPLRLCLFASWRLIFWLIGHESIGSRTTNFCRGSRDRLNGLNPVEPKNALGLGPPAKADQVRGVAPIFQPVRLDLAVG